ncbi:MAG: PIN domain-containing protein [Nanoarchaeota archaeon]|nr:PIN domain-containing protein [Nanoarchaeota archaeon]
MQYFLDTYAMIEIFLGNENYKNYIFDPEQAMCTIFNLMEAHFYFLKKFGQTKSDEIYELIKPIIIKIDDSTLKEANSFKLLHPRKRFSFTDCIGYITALKIKAKFITGDYAFKDFDNVEFVR